MLAVVVLAVVVRMPPWLLLLLPPPLVPLARMPEVMADQGRLLCANHVSVEQDSPWLVAHSRCIALFLITLGRARSANRRRVVTLADGCRFRFRCCCCCRLAPKWSSGRRRSAAAAAATQPINPREGIVCSNLYLHDPLLLSLPCTASPQPHTTRHTMSSSTTVDIPSTLLEELKRFRLSKAAPSPGKAAAVVIKVDKVKLVMSKEDEMDEMSLEDLQEGECGRSRLYDGGGGAVLSIVTYCKRLTDLTWGPRCP